MLNPASALINRSKRIYGNQCYSSSKYYVGHRQEKVTSVTKGSFLYQRKTKTNWVYSLMLDAFRRRAPSDMYSDLPVTWENIAQIYNDVIVISNVIIKTRKVTRLNNVLILLKL
jgi:hypothetical protein